MQQKIRAPKKVMISILILLVSISYSLAQAPTHLPQRDPEPTPFAGNPVNLIVYIIIPVVIAIIYFVWRRQSGKKE